MDRANITGLILAGGRGIRMGSVDKGLQLFRGNPMVQQVMQRLAPQVGQILINANQNTEIYLGLGAPVWSDVIPDFAGPLAGVHTGLSHCGTEFLVTVPCDSPLLPTDLVARLWLGLQSQDASIAVAVTGHGASRQSHPVFCMMKTALLPELTSYLARGGRKIDTWHKAMAAIDVVFDDDGAFANINTWDELQRLEKA